MAALTKDQILGADDIHREEVTIPEWNGSVWIRVMSSADRDAWEASLMPANGSGRPNMKNIRARLVARCACDEAGALLFAANGADGEALGGKSCAALDRLFDAAQVVNRIREEDVEELAKN